MKELTMNLLASGFNGHEQLTPTENEELAKDVLTFKRVATGDDIKVLFAGWSCTVYTTNNALHTIGHIGTTSPPLINPQTITFPHQIICSTTEISSVHGSHNGPLGLLTTNGSLCVFTNTLNTLSLQPLGDPENSPKISAIASTNANQTSITFLQSPASNLIHILTFPTYSSFTLFYTSPSSTNPTSYTHTMVPGRVESLSAGATSFALLTEEGEVWTGGDPRYSKCLGRTPSPSYPAEKPALIEALGGLPISKVDVSGWVFGALSRERDLYLWGSVSPGVNGEDGWKDLLGYGDEEVKLVEIEGVESIIDFGIGDGFIVALAEGGDLWVRGENGNGQMGIGEENKVITEWSKVKKTKIEEGTVVDVTVGALCIFLATQKRE